MGFNKELLPARESFWKNKPTWTITEFVYLLHGYDPVEFGARCGICPPEAMMLREELSNWLEWSPGCPNILPTERDPMGAPVAKNALISWASRLSEVDIPEWILKIVENSKHVNKKSQQTLLGERGQENLFATIGALASVIAKTKGSHFGESDNPNVQNIAAACVENVGEVYGMKDSAIRERISKGIQALKDKKL